jgi:hypothetical protein
MGMPSIDNVLYAEGVCCVRDTSHVPSVLCQRRYAEHPFYVMCHSWHIEMFADHYFIPSAASEKCLANHTMHGKYFVCT